MMLQAILKRYIGPLLLLSLVLGIGTIIWAGHKMGIHNVDITFIIMAFLALVIYIVFIRKPKIRKTDITDPSLQFPKTMLNGLKGKAVIRNFTVRDEVYENATLVARLFHLHVQVKGYDGSQWNALIKTIIPLSHIGSIEKEVTFDVLYNQINKYDIIIAPGQTDWHFILPGPLH